MTRILDFLVSGTLLLILCPLIALLILVSALWIGWPGVYVDQRVGLGGRLFKHFKIKTMRGSSGLGRAYLETSRIPYLGRLMRASHLDETLELVHILIGQMSLVGPRALKPEHAQLINFEGRTKVRPGWAGLAQVYLTRYKTLLSKEQARLEAVYLKKRRVRYDLGIMTATLREVLNPRSRGNRTKEKSVEYRKDLGSR